jgi:hypothetical protein
MSESKSEEKLYMNNEAKQVSVPLKQYMHDIRNGKPFTNEALNDINNLSYDERLKVLATYNEMMKYYVSLLYES